MIKGKFIGPNHLGVGMESGLGVGRTVCVFGGWVEVGRSVCACS